MTENFIELFFIIENNVYLYVFSSERLLSSKVPHIAMITKSGRVGLNADIRWETSTMYNFGTEISLFKNEAVKIQEDIFFSDRQNIYLNRVRFVLTGANWTLYSQPFLLESN